MIRMLTVSSLEKVFPGAVPQCTEQEASMLRNERFSFQACIFNDKRLSNGRAQFDVEGDISEHTAVRVVGLIPAHYANYSDKNFIDDYMLLPPEKSAALYPDLLRPMLPGDLFLRDGQWTALFITVHDPNGLPAGKHELRLTVTADGESASCTYTLDVVDAMLEKSDLIYTNWMHYDSIAHYYRVKPFSDEFYRIFDSFVAMAADHGMNMLYTPLFTPTLDTAIGAERLTTQLVGVSFKGGKYAFDFGELNKFMDFATERGIEYFEMSHLVTQWGATACPKIIADTDEGERQIFGWDTSSTGEEYTRFLHEFLPALDRFLKGKGIADRCYFHISDEPVAENYENFKRVFELIRPLVKGYKVMDATADRNNTVLDIPVLSVRWLPHGFKSEWIYACCSGCGNNMSNRFFNMPSQRTRILGMQLYLEDAKGYLHWGYNFYATALSYRQVDPFAEADGGGTFPAGDAFIVYPGTDGAWASIRLEALNDGFQDRMALKLLEKYVGRDKVVEMLHAEGMDWYDTYPHSAQWHISFRAKVNDMIASHVAKNK